MKRSRRRKNPPQPPPQPPAVDSRPLLPSCRLLSKSLMLLESLVRADQLRRSVAIDDFGTD